MYTVQKKKRKLYFSKFKHYIYTAFVNLFYFLETNKSFKLCKSCHVNRFKSQKHKLGISDVSKVPSKSVAGVPSSSCNSGSASAWHGSNYVANSLLWNGRPLCLQRYEKLIGCCWGIGSCSQASVQLIPYVLNWVQIWGKRGPGQGVDVVGGQKGCG